MTPQPGTGPRSSPRPSTRPPAARSRPSPWATRHRGQDPPETRLPVSSQWRRSYRRRTSAERVNATIKDTASNNIARGWCRLTGLTPLTLWIACLLVIRNQRTSPLHQARQADNARRAAAGLPPRTRKRRRHTTLASLAAAPP